MRVVRLAGGRGGRYSYFVPGSRTLLAALVLGLGCAPPPSAPPVAPEPKPTPAPDPPAPAFPAWASEASEKITAHAQKSAPRAWERLAYVADIYGHRLSGSKALEDTILWASETMAGDGLENARREKVMVPHWVRGRESVRVVEPVERSLVMLGLGGSVGTRRRGITAPIAVVQNVDEIAGQSEALAGKIVVINQVMPPYDREVRNSHYGETVPARSRGAIEAAKVGAKAVLIRSVTAHAMRNPHTGAMRYEDGVDKIPAAALAIEDIEFLARMAKRGRTVVELRMDAKTRKDTESANVVAELPGREKRAEVVVIGGHIDSWDVGDGSSDDMAGCIMAMEAARMLKELGLQPRRTIRVVLFTNEENGLRGGRAYHEAHGQEPHVAAMEADSGAAKPQGFGIKTEDPAQVEALARFAPLFAGIGATAIAAGHGGADISPLIKDGVLGISVRPDGSGYFDLHHSPADTVDKVDPMHLQMNAAAMALMAYILAERD